MKSGGILECRRKKKKKQSSRGGFYLFVVMGCSVLFLISFISHIDESDQVDRLQISPGFCHLKAHVTALVCLGPVHAHSLM